MPKGENMGPVQIVLVSDNHGRIQPLQYLRTAWPDAGYYLNCGDVCVPEVYAEGFACVKGNMDNAFEYPMSMEIEIGKHRILVVHGHRHLFRYNDYSFLCETARRKECGTVFFGHLHRYIDTEINGIRLLNPGSIRSNRDGTPPSYMIVTVTDDAVTAERHNYSQER